MNIYVGNLSYSVSEDDLKTAFGEFGEVESVKIITDKFSGQSKGFGFVEMPNKGEAQAALESLNGKDLKGRDLNINEAKPRSGDRGGGGRGGGGGYGGGRGGGGYGGGRGGGGRGGGGRGDGGGGGGRRY